MATCRRALASLDIELRCSARHELRHDQHHATQPQKEGGSSNDDNHAKTFDALGKVIESPHRPSNVVYVTLYTGASFEDGIADGIGAAPPERATQRTTYFGLFVHGGLSTGELHDCHHEPTQSNEE